MKNFTLIIIGVLSLGLTYGQNSHFHLRLPNTGASSAIQLRSVVPIYDSIYFWVSNPNTQTLELNSKDIDFNYIGNDYTSFINFSWNNTTWSDSYMQMFTFNSDNSVTIFLFQNWNGSAWVNYSRDTNTYNAKNLQTINLQQRWVNSAWVNNNRYLYSYNTGGNEITDTFQNWIGNVWINNSRDTIFYNSNNLEILDLSQSWTGTAWVNFVEDTMIYNSNNLETSDVLKMWNDSVWVNYSKDSYTYNSGNDVIVDLYQDWNGSNWVNSELSTYTYDINNIEVSGADIDYSVTGDTIIGSDSTHFYFSTAEGIKQLANNDVQISVYPNPSSDYIHASIQLNQPSALQLRLVNVLGQTVWVTNAGTVSNYQDNISVEDLPDGVYVLEVNEGTSTQQKEIVVAK